MQKLTTFLSAVTVMVFLTLMKGFFLDESDTGKEWALMAAWCRLSLWLARTPVPDPQRESTTSSPQGQRPAMISAQRRSRGGLWEA